MTKNVYVGNLSFDTTQARLQELAETHGQVSSVNIITDRQTGRPRGFAFVEMPDGNEAAEAIQQLNLAEIAGRAITVNEARPKTDRPRGGGGGGGGGRRRRGW